MKAIKKERIEKYMSEAQIDGAEFCRLCNIDPSSLNRIFSNKGVRIATMLKISKATKIPLTELFHCCH